MAREQLPIAFSVGPFTTTAVQISATELKVTSFIIQNPSTASDFIILGNNTMQTFFIAPGKDLAINGDNLDIGTSAYMNLENWYVVANAGIQNCNVLYLERY